MTITDYLRNALLDRAGVDLRPVGNATESLADLRESERFPELEKLDSNRMVMGRFRYGRLDRQTDTNYDRIGDAIRRLQAYQLDRNAEHLSDVRNLCGLEYVHGDNVWSPQDDAPHTPRC